MVGVAGQVVHRIGTPDGVMAVEVRGSEQGLPAVVFLHGLSASRVTWRPVAERLAPVARCLLVDLLGRGESDAAPAARYDLDSEVRRLEILLQRLGVNRPVLAGHSHGAAIAVAAAARLEACGLLLVNPVTPEVPRPAVLAAFRHRSVRALAAPLLRHFRGPLTRYILVRRVFAEPSSMPPGAVERYAAPWEDPRRAEGLTRILSEWDPSELRRWSGPPGVPVRVIAGALDRRITEPTARRWAARLEAGLRVETGCGHSVPEERPGAVVAVLEDLLRIAGSDRGRTETS